MMDKRLDVWELLKGVLIFGVLGGLAAFVFMYLVVGKTRDEAFLASAVVWAIALAVASLNGLVNLLPFFNALTNIFAASVGSALGGFLGEYRRVRGLRDENILDDIQESMAAVVNPAVDEALFRSGEGDIVSRYKLNSGLTNIILRYHQGKPISRNKMVADEAIDQRYWNLSYSVLQAIGLVGQETREFKTKGGLQLDLEFTGRRWRVSMGQEVWVLPEGAEQWQQLDLYECNFLRGKEPTGNDESPVA